MLLRRAAELGTAGTVVHSAAGTASLSPPHLQRACGQLSLSAHVQQKIQGSLCGKFCRSSHAWQVRKKSQGQARHPPTFSSSPSLPWELTLFVDDGGSLQGIL